PSRPVVTATTLRQWTTTRRLFLPEACSLYENTNLSTSMTGRGGRARQGRERRRERRRGGLARPDRTLRCARRREYGRQAVARTGEPGRDQQRDDPRRVSGH